MPRLLCNACNRPLVTCLCADIVQRDSDYPLILLQHPSEAKHALSSAPLLARSVSPSQLVVGEQFDPVDILGVGWQEKCVLLYPAEVTVSAMQVRESAISHVLVLDGTWRKTAKMLHLNPWLLQLPRLGISVDGPSRYRIRKSPRADGLSTIEAAARALNSLHGTTDFDDILGAFEVMIDRQIAAMGAETFRKNYS